MSKRVCPFWVGYWLASPIRRLMHNPEKILTPFITTGMTVLDIGPAMGFFTLPLARMVGANGKVVCVDVQGRMLEVLEKRARAAQLADRITTRVCTPTSLCLDDYEGKIDFALAFAVVHETADAPSFFAQLAKTLKPGAHCLVAEPKGHVKVPEFEESLLAAKRQGLIAVATPSITGSRTAVLKKQP